MRNQAFTEPRLLVLQVILGSLQAALNWYTPVSTPALSNIELIQGIRIGYLRFTSLGERETQEEVMLHEMPLMSSVALDLEE